MATWHRELTADERAALPKGERLLHDLTEAFDEAFRQARRLRARTIFCRWASVICAGVAVISGFVAKLPQVRQLIEIQPWMISAVAGLGAAIQVIQHKVSWPSQSEEYRRHCERLRSFILQAEYETAVADEAQIASLSRGFREEKDRLEASLHNMDTPNRDQMKTG